jgi:hypothetical protein
MKLSLMTLVGSPAEVVDRLSAWSEILTSATR